MTTIKSYTDINQSRKLAKILPIESADMYYTYGDETEVHFGKGFYEELENWSDDGSPRPVDVPCWSLAALLNYLREIDYFPEIFADKDEVSMNICYYESIVHEIYTEAENFIDTCYKMILKLHKRKVL